MSNSTAEEKKTRGGKREEILRAALKVFAEGGVNGVPVPRIAAEAGVSPGLLYRYFDNKEDMVNELFREQKRKLSHHIFSDLKEGGDHYKNFCVVWARLVSFIESEPDAFRFMELQDHRPYLTKQSTDYENKHLAVWMQYYKSMQKQGVYRKDIKPEILLTLFWGAFINLFKSTHSGLIAPSKRELNRARDVCWSMLVGNTSG
ncbi:MAG: TetR/AcrR family transcriptional regulator [Pseudomonadales bacterium]|nr:TetR/AcrR family transcriptional regulator [Pseudomonadales bacterium]